jgi:hypothetical protein
VVFRIELVYYVTRICRYSIIGTLYYIVLFHPAASLSADFIFKYYTSIYTTTSEINIIYALGIGSDRYRVNTRCVSFPITIRGDIMYTHGNVKSVGEKKTIRPDGKKKYSRYATTGDIQ